MSKLNWILAAILALQIVVLVVVYWPETSVASGQPLFSDVEAGQIVKLTIRDGAGQEIQMAKGSDGWSLPDAGDFPVDEVKVSALLDKITNLRADSLVTRTPDSQKRLQVAADEFERLIEFELQDGTSHKLYLGSSPRYQVLHVRADAQDEVYLVLGLTTTDAAAAAASWINQTYFTAPEEQIVAVTLENANGRFEFQKDEADAWTMINLPAGETLRENNVVSLVARIASMNMQRPLGREESPSYGLDDPNAVVTVLTRDENGDEKTYILRVGDMPEDGGGYVVKSATSPYYVLMTEYSVKDLIERTMADFIEVPPTPTPASPQEPTPMP